MTMRRILDRTCLTLLSISLCALVTTWAAPSSAAPKGKSHKSAWEPSQAHEECSHGTVPMTELLAEESKSLSKDIYVPQSPEEVEDLIMKDDEISIMVVYTADAKWGAFRDRYPSTGWLIESGCRYEPIDPSVIEFCDSLNLDEAIEDEIADRIEYLNEAFANSGTHAEAVLVHSREIQYEELAYVKLPWGGAYYHPPMQDHLDWIRKKMNGHKDYKKNIYKLREKYEADIVSLWIQEGTTSGGIGGYPTRPGKTSVNVLSRYRDGERKGRYLFAHEVGHNLGLRHDYYADKKFSAPTPGGYSDYEGRYRSSHGYVDLCHGFRTIMAYDKECKKVGVDCPVIPYFSNPNIDTDEGYPTGTWDEFPSTNNARTIRKNWRWVANFRNSTAPKSGSSPGLEPSYDAF